MDQKYDMVTSPRGTCLPQQPLMALGRNLTYQGPCLLHSKQTTSYRIASGSCKLYWSVPGVGKSTESSMRIARTQAHCSGEDLSGRGRCYAKLLGPIDEIGLNSGGIGPRVRFSVDPSDVRESSWSSQGSRLSHRKSRRERTPKRIIQELRKGKY